MPESITIIVPTEGKQIEVEVEPYHTPKDIIDLVISQLKLRSGEWILTLGSKEITSSDTRTLGEIGVRNGDVLHLMPRVIGGYVGNI
ncbi:hypothetical protein KEJ17_01520 [Candidatus Bathyarchaeota archaeon]|nr:hypothetical protein [Candidatus Bathyarchaeota archaeon]